MRSPFSLRNWILFIAINLVISAVTAYIVVRMLTQAASRPDPAVLNAPLATATIVPNTSAAQPAVVPTQAPSNGAAADATGSVAEAAQPASTENAAQNTTMAPTDAASTPSAQPAAAVPTSTVAATPANVRISTVVFAGQRTREAVVIVNEGEQVDLTGWTIANPRGQIYTFGSVLLFKESFINLHTTKGVDVPTDLFWNQDAAMWQKGDTATLKRGTEVMATFEVK